MSTPKLHPLNDLPLLVTISTVNAAGRLIPFTASTSMRAFLATSDTPTATAADATLNTVPTYTGAGGKWMVTFNKALLTPSLLNTHFASAVPYCIVENDEDVRVAIRLEYAPTKLIEAT